MSNANSFVPALGWRSLTPLYDPIVRIVTREATWRSAFLAQISPRSDEVILDVGCGTGSLAILLKQSAPGAHIVGLDPDTDILERAAAKAKQAGVEIEWRQGFARDAGQNPGAFDKTVSSLVFHQVPVAEKQAGIDAMIAGTKPSGEVHIADFAAQRSRFMRAAFGVVGRVDGSVNTQPNADGAIERILSGVSPEASIPTAIFRTPLGEISLFRLIRTGRSDTQNAA
ncbi:MAG: class I SAM-dependent methyltransferase [Hyphomicrobiaceae bacterium]